jgi:hypothetical protein
MGKEALTRRNFIRKVGSATLGFGLGTLFGCTASRPNILSRGGADGFHSSMEDWDPIYGPSLQWYSRYGGRSDFQGHRQGRAAPGLDYDIPTGTPLVPSMMSYLIQINQDRKGSRFVLMSSVYHPPFQISFGHLDQTLVDDRYQVPGKVFNFLGNRVRILSRGEIIALSGNSGLGPPEYGGIQPPHLHLSAFWDDGIHPYENLDPEKFGPDSGHPIFWDGRTHLDVEPEKRLSWLGRTLQDLEMELERWPEGDGIGEVKKNLLELNRSIENPVEGKILDSKYFQDLKAYLKKIVLEQKKFIPGTDPYSLMLKVMGYSTDPKQKVILTLPFIAPGLKERYHQTVFEQGQFLTILPQEQDNIL